jgi:hypothetical protein
MEHGILDASLRPRRRRRRRGTRALAAVGRAPVWLLIAVPVDDVTIGDP